MSFAILGPSGNVVKLTKADDTVIAVPRSLWVGTAGTANIDGVTYCDTRDIKSPENKWL